MISPAVGGANSPLRISVVDRSGALTRETALSDERCAPNHGRCGPTAGGLETERSDVVGLGRIDDRYCVPVEYESIDAKAIVE